MIFVVKRNMVDILLAHLSSRHKNIQFTVEREDGRLPVLDKVVQRLPDGRLNEYHSFLQATAHREVSPVQFPSPIIHESSGSEISYSAIGVHH